MKTSENQASVTYTHGEIEEILQMAIARHSLTKNEQETMTQHELWGIAKELGIDQQTIIDVEKSWHKQQLLEQKRNEFNQYRKEEFQNKIIRFVIINLFLVAINLLGGHQLSWSLYVILIWGLFLALNGWETFVSKGENYEKAFINWERKSQVKEYVTILWTKLQNFMQSLTNSN